MQPPRTTVPRRVEWVDTDASGAHHYTTAFRFAEAGESALHRELGIEDRTFGHLPRVRAEADFRHPLRFGDEALVEFAVERVGHSSVEYRFAISRSGVLCVEGAVVAVHVGDNGHPTPWPDDLRRILSGNV